MHSTARKLASGESRAHISVSWPSRTESFSRASTAKESLAAASTTTSLIEFEPTSMAAIFMQIFRAIQLPRTAVQLMGSLAAECGKWDLQSLRSRLRRSEKPALESAE